MPLVALDHVTRLERPKYPGQPCFDGKAQVCFPVAIKDILERIDKKQPPGGALAPYFTRARRLPREAWEWAAVDLDEFVSQADVTTEKLHQRDVALELARLWFTEHLHRSIGEGPMVIRWLAPTWKLSDTNASWRE